MSGKEKQKGDKGITKLPALPALAGEKSLVQKQPEVSATDLAKLKTDLTPRQAKLIKAVVTEDARFLQPKLPPELTGKGLSDAEIVDFIVKARQNPGGIGIMQSQMAQGSSHPHEYLVARAELNETVNGLFITQLPVEKPPEPEQKSPAQKAPEPEQKLPEPEQKPPEPEQKAPEPEQKAPEPEQKLPEPEQKSSDPNQPVVGEVLQELTFAHDEAWEANLETLVSSITSRPGRLIKAVVTDDTIYVDTAQVPVSLKDKNLTPDDVEDFVDMAETDPAGLVVKEDKMIRTISRETKLHPDDWQWTGRRALYQIVRANLNKRVNELFGTNLPVLESELSAESIQAEIKKQQQVQKAPEEPELKLKPLPEEKSNPGGSLPDEK